MDLSALVCRLSHTFYLLGLWRNRSCRDRRLAVDLASAGTMNNPPTIPMTRLTNASENQTGTQRAAKRSKLGGDPVVLNQRIKSFISGQGNFYGRGRSNRGKHDGNHQAGSQKTDGTQPG